MVPQLQHLEAGQIRYQPLVSFLILDPSPDQKPEPLGWHLLIRFLLNSGALQGKRVGLIVDSELGDHVQINTRKKPYYADQMLPGNIALIYASADKSDTFANHMIKKCDEIARMLLKRFVAHPQQAIPHERVFVVSGATCIYIDHTGSHARA
jgi:hypothetical protein